MYKKFFMGIAAVAALTLVSCSSDDLNSLSDNSSKNEAISFDGYLGRSAVSVNGSRGSVEKKDQLKTDGFGVFGNYNSTGGQNFGSNLFNNVKVYSSSTVDPVIWTYENKKYWPTEGHIDFLAYAPHVDKKQLKGSSIDFTVEGEAANQIDLLWANVTNQTKDNKTVTFNFKHALAKIGYKVQLNGDYTGTTIKLNKITLAGSKDGTTKKAFYKERIINLSTGAWTPSTSDEKLNFEWFANNDGTKLTTTATDNADNYLFVIPQNFSASATDQLYVIVDYTITYSDNTTVKTKVCKQLKKEFLQGKAYTINLTIGLTPIEFNATVEGWGDIEDYPITLE